MSTITTGLPLESLLMLQSVIGGLLQLLTPGEKEGRAPANLDPLLNAALTQARQARLNGVIELLRIWSAAMAHRVSARVSLSEDEQGRAHAWFSDLRSFCQGRLDTAGQQALLDRAAVITELTFLPPRLSVYLLERLGETTEYIHALLEDAAKDLDRPSGPEEPAGVALPDSSVDRIDAADASMFIASDAVFDGSPVLPDGEIAIFIRAAEPVDAQNMAIPHVLPALPDAVAARSQPWVGFPDATGMERDTEYSDVGEDGALLAAATATIGSEMNDPIGLETGATDGGAYGLLEEDHFPPQTEADQADWIWISPEELQLALDAMGNQILPLICMLPQAQEQEARGALIADLEFNFGLVGNAMEMLGTPELSRGVVAMQTRIASDLPPEPEDLLNWSATLVAFLEQPNEENAELLTALSGEVLFELGSGWAESLHREAGRIRIGIDPKLQAQRKITATAEDVSLQLASDVLPNVLDGMLSELPGNAEHLGNAIRRLIATGDIAPIETAQRVAHTLKGDANTVGVNGLANLSHSLEDLLIVLNKHPQRLVPGLGRALDQAVDCVEQIADYLLGRGPAPANLLAVYQSILDWNNTVLVDAVSAAHDAGPAEAANRSETWPATDLPASPASMATDVEHSPGVSPDVVEPELTRAATRLTVSAGLLDELQRLAGEALVMARQIDQRLDLVETMHREQATEMRSSSSLLDKLDDLISLRGAALQSTALRDGRDVDPLELDQYSELHGVSRRLLESHSDNNEYQHRFDALLVELEGLRSQQESVHADLQRVVQRARTVPFDQIAARLQRIVRQTARQLDREVELRLVGEKILLDADLLDRIVEPLGHLLRNAVDHGIEDPKQRLATGKPQAGTIQLSVRTMADSVEIRIEDDGRGLDYAGIRNKAMALRLLTENQEVSDLQLAQLILVAGFTTRQEATHVSGRGIGMDIVNQRVIDLRGRLSLVSVRGRGLSVTMRLPVSQTMANVIIAYGHGLILAAVAGSVERVHSFSASELTFMSDGQIMIEIEGAPTPVYPIESLYGRSEGRRSLPTANGLGLLIRNVRGKHVMVSVASIGEVSNVIVKPISSFLPPVPSVRGMTLLGDGRLAAVVDVATLIDVLDADTQGLRLSVQAAELAPQLRVVVADDSLSVRRALTELMEDAGYEVHAARDGLEALELIESISPALVLLDLEMPKLNGLEVTRFMRGRPQTRHVPILMITSRASEKYRTQADEAGVNLMLGKPFSEDDLIVTIRKLMAESAARIALERA